MVDQQMRRRGIRDERVLAVMSEVPREEFVSLEIIDHAYNDQAMGIGHNQTISQPYIVAYMTEMLDVDPHHRVLEVGTGSGYQTAILSLLCQTVYTVESLDALAQSARKRLGRLGYRNIEYRLGDGTVGWPEHAPFDRMMVTAGAPETPAVLTEQLAVGGKMILPVGRHGDQRLVLIDRLEKRFVESPLIGCRFVKLLGRFGWKGETGEHPGTDA